MTNCSELTIISFMNYFKKKMRISNCQFIREFAKYRTSILEINNAVENGVPYTIRKLIVIINT